MRKFWRWMAGTAAQPCVCSVPMTCTLKNDENHKIYENDHNKKKFKIFK
jgi:hypothetical protein